MSYLLFTDILADVVLILMVVWLVLRFRHQQVVERSLAAREANFRMMADNMIDAIWTVDLDGTITYASPSVETVLGYLPEELIGTSAAALVLPADHHRITASIDAFVRANAHPGPSPQNEFKFEVALGRKDDREIWAEVSLRVALNARNEPTGLVGVLRDITKRKRAEWQVAEYQHQLRKMASRISLVAEEERRKIAADLHDSVGQTLSATKMKIAALKRSCRDQPTTVKALDELLQMVDHTIRDTRSLMLEVSPPILYELGFLAATEWYLERVEKEHGIHCTFTSRCERRQMGDEWRGMLFRIVRELVHNVIKHAHASSLEVDIRTADERLLIRISDNGMGFEPDGVGESGPTTPAAGFGLFSVYERVGYLGGRMTVASSPGGGTRVELEFPLAKIAGPEAEEA